MGSILRSSKFVRHFPCFARSIVLSPARGDVNGTFIQKSRNLSVGLSKSLATQAIPSHSHSDTNLDKSLRRLDQDVRRTGRITRRELEDILEELRHTRSATSSQSLLIIRCCGNLLPEASSKVRTQLVEEIWKTLEKIGVRMDISHFNALLRVYLENEHPFSPTEFLANLEHKGVEPNRVTYQRLISQYCQQGDIEGATRILECMREKQQPVNEHVFNALIMGHSHADDMESAAGILGVMQQAGLEPSADTYATLLCGYAKKGDIGAIIKTLEQCDAKDVQLLDRDYMDIIYSLAVNNHHEHVDMLIGRMRQSAGYNQDAVNLILRLVNHGLDDLGYKILLTMPRPSRSDGEQGHVGVFFVRQLVNVNRPVEKIISICEKLENEDLNPRALSVAIDASLQAGNVDQAFALLLVMQKRNLPIRQHYFWPLLARQRKNIDSVVNILFRMCSEFNLTPGGETLMDYVIPCLEKVSSDEMVLRLRSAGITTAAAAAAVVQYRLNKNLIAEAAQVAMRYRAYYSSSTLRRPLVQAYCHTKDNDSFIAILRQIHGSADKTLLADEDLAAVLPDRAEIVGNIVLDIANVCQNQVANVEAILQGMVEHGLCLSTSSAERLQEKLGEELTSEISNLLGKLTSGELVPTTLPRSSSPPIIMDEGQLLKIQKMLEEKGDSTRGIKKQLFILYCRSKDIQKVEQIKKELEADNFVITSGLYAQLADVYAHHDKLQEMWDTVTKLQEIEPDFSVDSMKIIKIIALLIKNNRVADAIQFLTQQSGDRKLEDRSFQYRASCWRLLNSIAEEGRVEDLRQVFDTLVKHEYIEANNVLLGPMIKVHVVRNDLAAAVEQFEWCCQQYRATPWKNELACKLIQAEDAVSLQKLTDLSTQIHGEVNSLYDLVFAFVECGRIRQARKILETPGLRNRPQRLNSACERYQQEGMVATLEGLVEATRDMVHIDRSDIYYHLLLTYCKSKEADKALGLWTRMQEEDVQPSDTFLSVLGNFLKEEGKEVPFVIPDTTEVNRDRLDSQETQEVGMVLTTTQKFRQALRRNDIQGALAYKQIVESSGNQTLSAHDMSTLIDGLVRADRCGEASKVALGMLGKGLLPQSQSLRFLLNRLAAAGDIDTFTAIGNQLPPLKKKFVSFDNRLCHAYIVAGKAAEYLKTLTEEIENAKENDLENLKEKFPRGGAIGILTNHPELQSEYERLALMYAARGMTAPINVLWMYLFSKGEDAAAKNLWDEHIAHSPRIMFKYILGEARMKCDEDMVRRLIPMLQGTAVAENALGSTFSCLIDVLVKSNRCDDALVVLKDAMKDVCLENMTTGSLLRLQSGLQKEGKTFPYEIPLRKAKSSSSSSSDDESSTVDKKQ